MDRNEITKLESLFHALVDIPRGADRDAAAIRLSGGDADLARRALALVDSDEQAEAVNHAARQAGSAPRTYGNYRTIRPLGAGGMGAVYLAERADGQFQQKFEGAAKGQAYYYLAILNARRDNFAAASEFARQFYESTLKSIGPAHWRTAQAKILWVRGRAEAGDTRETVEQAREAMQVVRKALPPLSSTLWTPLNSTSRILNLAGRFAEAEPLAREQLAIVDHLDFPEVDARRAVTLVELGTALQGEKKHREATSTFERADRIFAQLGPSWASRAEQVKKKLSELRSQAKK